MERNINFVGIVYYAFLCIWSLSFDSGSEEYFSDGRWNITESVITGMKMNSKEKLSKIAFKIFKNISKWPKCIELMNDNELIKVIENELKKNIKDDNLRINLESLNDELENNYKIASSYEKYTKELETGKLNWGPCHNERFWKANSKFFSEHDYMTIKKVIRLLETSQNNLTLAVACYDLGEFCRFVPYSKVILENSQSGDLGGEGVKQQKGKTGKALLMEMITHKDRNVKEQALLATQKMMIHNWQNVKA